jgi:hypothetical protein
MWWLAAVIGLGVAYEFVRRSRFSDFPDCSEEEFVTTVLNTHSGLSKKRISAERSFIALTVGLPRRKVSPQLTFGEIAARADAGLALQPGDLRDEIERVLGAGSIHTDSTMAALVYLLVVARTQ